MARKRSNKKQKAAVDTAVKLRVKSKMNKANRARAKEREQRMKYLRYGGLVAIVIFAFIALVLSRNSGTVPTSELGASVEPNLLGPADAPVKLVEYGDLACSACRQWHNLGVWEQLTNEYGDQISFEFKHYPVITANSPTGAQAAQCAAEQGEFWTYHDYIYENLGTYPAFTSDFSKEIATAVNLDRAAFDSCLDSGKYRRYVTDAIREAQSVGARGTPTFFLNGKQVAPDFNSLSQAIEQELN